MSVFGTVDFETGRLQHIATLLSNVLLDASSSIGNSFEGLRLRDRDLTRKGYFGGCGGLWPRLTNSFAKTFAILNYELISSRAGGRSHI
jgi:hypothetical protein